MPIWSSSRPSITSFQTGSRPIRSPARRRWADCCSRFRNRLSSTYEKPGRASRRESGRDRGVRHREAVPETPGLVPRYDGRAEDAIPARHARPADPRLRHVPQRRRTGGGPFWVSEPDGGESLQIVESSQIAPGQKELMARATHFNPVDVACGLKNYLGRRFDLRQWTDPQTGFISEKSQQGRPLRPWSYRPVERRDGAMEYRVRRSAILTFAPVKIVQRSLLRRQHRTSLNGTARQSGSILPQDAGPPRHTARRAAGNGDSDPVPTPKTRTKRSSPDIIGAAPPQFPLHPLVGPETP